MRRSSHTGGFMSPSKFGQFSMSLQFTGRTGSRFRSDPTRSRPCRVADAIAEAESVSSRPRATLAAARLSLWHGGGIGATPPLVTAASYKHVTTNRRILYVACERLVIFWLGVMSERLTNICSRRQAAAAEM